MLVLLDPFAKVKAATARVILRLIWRIALLGLLASVIASLVLIALRLTALWGLPNASEPFDTAAFRAPEIPAERDMIALYPLAAARFKPFARHEWANPLKTAVRGGWRTADNDIRSWLAENREALNLWRQAAERPEASLRRPDARDLLSGPPLTVFALLLLAQLEASRLEADGDMVGAWAWYRACLRMIRHIQDYDPLHLAADTQRYGYFGVLACVNRWAGDSRTDSTVLRRALDDAQSLDSSHSRGSDAFKLEYLSITLALSDPPPELAEQAWNDLCSHGDDTLWYRHIPLFHESRWFIRNEPERSRRVARLVFANWIANCERPSSLWPSSPTWAPINSGGTPLFLLNHRGVSGAPAPLEGLTAAELSKWYDSTPFLRRLLNKTLLIKLDSYQLYVVWRRADQAKLILNLAEQLYAREHGGQLPASPKDLVGPYFSTLPAED